MLKQCALTFKSFKREEKMNCYSRVTVNSKTTDGAVIMILALAKGQIERCCRDAIQSSLTRPRESLLCGLFDSKNCDSPRLFGISFLQFLRTCEGGILDDLGNLSAPVGAVPITGIVGSGGILLAFHSPRSFILKGLQDAIRQKSCTFTVTAPELTFRWGH